MRRCPLALAALSLLLAAPAARAQPAAPQGWALDRFEPAPAGDPFFLAEHPWYSSTRILAAALVLEHALSPLALRREYADGTVREDAIVSIPHPICLDDATRARWSEVFASYEILSAFPQLERTVYRDASLVSSREIHPGKVLGLRERGWRLLRRQSGNVDGLERTFATGTLRVDVAPGFWPERLAEVPMQLLGVLEATSGDPSSIAWSEAIRDLLG